MASKQILFLTILFSVFVFGGTFTCSQEISEIDAQKRQVEKLMEASVSNSIAIENGDLLWRQVVFFDSTELEKNPTADQSRIKLGKVIQSESLHRLIFDYPNKRFCYIVKSINKVEDFETDKQGVSRISWSGFVDDQQNNKAYLMDSPGTIQKFASSRETSSPANSFRFPDLRVPQLSKASSIESLRKGIQGFVQSGKVKKYGLTKKGFEVAIEWPESEVFIGNSDVKAKHSNYSEAFYDRDSLQLTESKMWSTGPDGTQYDSGSASIIWEEHNGIFVTRSVSFDRPIQVTIFGEPTIGQEETTKRFHWFSVNSGVSDHNDVFDGKAFKSLEAVEALVDPIKTNAEGLIESKPSVEKQKESQLQKQN